MLERICIVCGKIIRAERFRRKESETMCKTCANRAIAMHRKKREPMTGERNPAWKGGMIVSWGYVYLRRPEHPMASKTGYVKRANLVWEEHTGIYPPKGMILHHKDGDKQNDCIENLELMAVSKHMSLHNRGERNPRYKAGKYAS